MNSTKKTKIMGIIFMTVLMLAMLFPFLWIFITSFKTSFFGSDAFQIIPNQPTLKNYTSILFEEGILAAIKNSFIVSLLTTIYVTFAATLIAYAISRFHFIGKNVLLGVILGVAMFPQMILVGPIYTLFDSLGLTNSYAVILPYSSITLPIAVWILVTHFNEIPIDMEESAKMDGATSFQTLRKIIFPLAAPGVFTSAIIVFITAWNEFVFSLTLNTNQSYHTIPVAISFLRTQFEILWGEVTAATIVVAIPTVIIVLLLQKRIVSGLTSGSVKG